MYQYDNIVEEFRSLYCKATGCNEEEWNAKIKKMIPSKTQFRDSFKITLERAPFVFTSDDLGNSVKRKFLGKVLQVVFSLARYLDNYFQPGHPLTSEAISFIRKEIGLLTELNVNDNSDANEIIGYFKEIDDLATEGRSLGERSKGIVRLIKEKL